jgi:hypothetical protein
MEGCGATACGQACRVAFRLHPAAAGSLNMVAALATFGFTAVAHPGPPCSEEAPCVPQPAASLLIGMMGAVVVLGFIHLKLTAITAIAVEVGVIWHDLARPQEAASGMVHVALIVLAVICALLAMRVRSKPPRSRPGWGRFGTAAFLVVLAFGFLILATYQQAQADERTRAAETVTTTVREHVDFDTVVLAFPDGHTESITVYESQTYPVGSKLRMSVDDDGWRQPVSEPYDATPWVALAGLVGLIGAGLLWRYADHARTFA